jgi:UDP-glucose 4-epimerase
MRCLILGGCGFIGSNVAEKLLTRGYRVRIFDTPTASRVNLASIESQIDFCGGDFLNEADIDCALKDVDFVFHLVGTTLPANSNRRPVFDVQSNVIATIQLLEATLRHSVKRLVFASSGGTVYGESQRIPITEDHPTDPLCSYGITKLAIEKYLRLYGHLNGLNYTILRISNPYGKYQKFTAEQGVIGVFLSRIRENRPITIWGDGSVVRDYIYVEDVANAFVNAITQDSQYRVFNIGTGVGTSLRNLLQMMERVTGIKPKVDYAAGRPVDVSLNVLDPTRAHGYMNWHAETGCEAGLHKTWSWLCGTNRGIPTAPGEMAATS